MTSPTDDSSQEVSASRDQETLAIKREKLTFHPTGTLRAVTRWVSGDADGVSEWLKNVRRHYQVDRANVLPEHRAAVILLKDQSNNSPGRIGVLDVGGATLEDISAWSMWQNPDASSRKSGLDEEETQGNGGKAYMFAGFTGPARIFGVKNQKRNCMGFVGPEGSEERGTPGWIPSDVAARDAEVSSWEAELQAALAPYGVSVGELPESVQLALKARKAFTLVEGESPIQKFKGRIDSEDLLSKVVRHDQATLCLEQMKIFAIHNRKMLNEGEPLSLPSIPPYIGFETPVIVPVPDRLPTENGDLISTTENGSKASGRLTLHTSKDDMPNAFKKLKPRWQISYRTAFQMIGAKPIGDLVPTLPGSHYVYGSVELSALEPLYVEHGRRRPKDGPLVEALDRFIADHIKSLAQKINAHRRKELDRKTLNEVLKENRILDEFKNRFLPSGGEGQGGSGQGGTGGTQPVGPSPAPEYGTIPASIELSVPSGGIHVALGVTLNLDNLTGANVVDTQGRKVPANLTWIVDDLYVGSIDNSAFVPKAKGTCKVFAQVNGSKLRSASVNIEVWNIEHVLLTPRKLDIPLGRRERITAEVTDDSGRRSTEVILNWKAESEDPLTVRINRTGVVTANRIGKSLISAGAGDTWSRTPSEVSVIQNLDANSEGGGFPRLLLTDQDVDPATNEIREGDPDQPPIWQETSDHVHNIWWLNLQNPEVRFAFQRREKYPELWRAYHVQRLVEMIVQVWMKEEFTNRGDHEKLDYWANHHLALDRHRVRITQEIWSALGDYAMTGETPVETEGAV